MYDIEKDLTNKLYTANQTKIIDQQVIAQQFQSDELALMTRAAFAAFDKIKELYPHSDQLIIFCGPGNNGGDGLILAYLAAKQNFKTTVVNYGSKSSQSISNKKALIQYKNIISKLNYNNHQLLIYHENESLEQIFDENITNTNGEIIYIDALFGTGLNKPLDDTCNKIIEFINTKKNIVALDIPTGLHADNGKAGTVCVQADVTIAFITLKQGLFTGDGPDYSGNIYLETLGVDTHFLTTENYSSWLLNKNWAKEAIRTYLPPRTKNSHKHQFGHVLIIGGNIGMPGAVNLAGYSAMRVGAGLVTIVTHAAHNNIITQNHPEIMTYGITEDGENLNNEKLKQLFSRATVIILGPGLGLTKWSQQVFKYSMEQILINYSSLNAIVVDADGLTLLSEYNIDINKFKDFRHFENSKFILTPHPGEAKKLLSNYQLSQPLSDLSRFEIIREIVNYYSAITILKGAGTLIDASNHKIAVCPAGNPGMATAGMGDILSGIIAGLAAQGVDNYLAAILGVYLHARSGDLQAKKFGERGIMATDILIELRQLLNDKE